MQKNRVFYCFFLILLLIFPILCLNITQTAYANFETSAKSMCLMEATTHRVLRAKNENEKRPMASTTKIMTAITAIENCQNLDEKFEVSKDAIGVSGTSIYLKEGEKFSVRELLYGLMLVSGNDASVAIGERVGGSVEYFVDMMNNLAKKIGAKNTHFENTHGLDEKGHYTTAYDLALISSYALQNSTFKEIVGTKNKKITNSDGKERYLQNKNKLLKNFDGANGVKTGFTDDAGRCFVGSAERDGMTLVCSILSCGPMFEDCEELLNEGFDNYKMVDVTSKVSTQRQISVENGKAEKVIAIPKEKFFYPLKNGEEKKLNFEINLCEKIVAPLEKGSEVGEIKIFFDKNLIFSLKFITIEDVEAKGVIDKFFDILKWW